ncbi:LysR family transcriptional regulator [Rathayibacter sp. VKM Ac-2754]|uniref:LysR family transcriptional regulator n=1 Tax=Rathayibacter sp. VKM Ac-2754 TaxID=2609251 RepID=UPI00135BCD19|nr:LysR family transcriptional regulator [Rathayibacter sp. VKM Ac-2754]MWV57670.1 LysR family transcriptional regulator [Rathayibacter sp. VKM Ac-2754]
MIEPSALRALIAVRDCGTIAAAAEALGFTPSAVSQQLKRLERQSGAPVAERSGRTVFLTEHGRSLAGRGERLLAELEALEHLGAAPAEEVTGTLRVVAFSTAMRGLLVPALGEIRRRAPRLRLTLDELDPWEASGRLERGAADLAILHDWPGLSLDLPPSIETETLLEDRADVLLHRDHPLAGLAEIASSRLADETWVSIPAGAICHAWLLRTFAGTGRRPDIAFYDEDFSTHISLVEAGAAVALVPRLGREPLPEAVVAVPAVDPVSRRIVSAAWRRSSGANPALALVLDALRPVVGAPLPQN